MAEYILGDPNTLVELPDEVAFDQAAPLMCAGVSRTLLNTLTTDKLI